MLSHNERDGIDGSNNIADKEKFCPVKQMEVQIFFQFLIFFFFFGADGCREKEIQRKK